MKTNSKRYLLIDSLRGLALVSMILYHFCYDVFIVYGRNPGWHRISPVHWWQQSICCTFILISGISFHFVRNKIKQGVILNACGLIITAVTLIALPEEAIWFGILNFMGCAVLCLAFLEPLAKKVTPQTGIFVSLMGFILTRHITSGEISLFTLFSVSLPDWLYTPKLTTILGFPHPGFVSSDYFPLFPWFFLYLIGYYLWPLLRDVKILKTVSIPGLSTIGKYTLPVYMIHQPLCMVTAWLLSLIW